jgi:hypothetical protein
LGADILQEQIDEINDKSAKKEKLLQELLAKINET